MSSSESKRCQSRLAPTPSGFLHTGNAVNFALTALITAARDGEIRLRIDDLDTQRVRPEYIENIFETVHWLGIKWQHGPGNISEAEAASQRHRIPKYNALIGRLVSTGRVYACVCTRSEVRARTGSTAYDGYCRNAGHALTEPRALRFVSRDPESGGDFIIRRRDMLPAYHIASLADDLAFGINLIVRGEDLLSATAAQRELAHALGAEGEPFLAAQFLHHPLVFAKSGEKLSKTQGARRAQLTASREQIFALAERMLRNL